MNTRVLWFTNLPIGEAPALMGSQRSVFGGWLQSLFRDVSLVDQIRLSVAFPTMGSGSARFDGRDASYYLFPSGQSGSEPTVATVARLRSIMHEVQPDLVHVFGTELPHSVAVMRICHDKGIPSVLHIQGLMGSYAQHYTGQIPCRVARQRTPLERIRRTGIRQSAARFRAAGELEAETLNLADHILGRTTYDRAWAAQVNPQAQYHISQESLRDTFYEGERWSLTECEKYSIFVSQATVPYKGAHFAISALPIILRQFSGARLVIAGPDPVGDSRARRLVRRTTYGWYLKRLIDDLGLRDHVSFVGSLDETAMRERYRRSHVFLSCSSIDNSPNSVCEAQLMGMPVVASYVGGVPDLVEHAETGLLYQFDAPYMLAHFVNKVFAHGDLATQMGLASHRRALARHDRTRNLERVTEIYDLALRPRVDGAV